MLRKIEYLMVGERGDKSLSDFRRAVLIAYSILISFVTSVYYSIINLFKNYNPASYVYYIFIVVLIIVFWINRSGKHWLAKSIFLTVINFVVFVFCSREPPVPAAFLFFIICSLMALVAFDAREKKSSMMFVGLSVGLFLTARLTTFSLVPFTKIDPEYLVRAYNNNLAIVYFFSVLAVYYLVRINYSVEESLQIREKQILEKNQTLIKTNEELDRFIYSTSHDLRAPLNSIEGLINLSELTTNTDDLATYHAMMRERVQKLEKILSDISVYSKNTKLDIERKSINLRDHIKLTLYDVQYIEGLRHIDVRLDVAEDIVIVTDPMRLTIILNNLISNAFKYSDPMKEQSYVNIRARMTDNKVTLIIEDNGEGIDAAMQPKIFEMFFRGTTRSTGSGLGLYLVQETIQKLEGTINLTSSRGQGTTFTVTLPA